LEEIVGGEVILTSFFLVVWLQRRRRTPRKMQAIHKCNNCEERRKKSSRSSRSSRRRRHGGGGGGGGEAYNPSNSSFWLRFQIAQNTQSACHCPRPQSLISETKKQNPTQPNNNKAFCDERRGVEEEGEEERLVVEVMSMGRHVS
jgi:hypothetical protein